MWCNTSTKNAIEICSSLIALIFPVDFNSLQNKGGKLNIHLPEWMLIDVYHVPAPYKGMVQTSGTLILGMWIFTTTKVEYNGTVEYRTRYENRYL